MRLPRFLVEEKIGTLIGPEGGWNETERELFLQERIPIYTLGHQTLRAETAAVAVISLLLLEL